jgi:uncharacterized membrane protein
MPGDLNCPQCHTPYPAGAKFCASCGRALSAEEKHNVRFLCYLGGIFSGVIFLNLDPYRRDAEIRFHAWQSIFFALTAMGVWVLGGTFPFFLIPVFPIALFLHCGVVVLWILLMVKAYNGDRFKLPMLGELAEKRAAISSLK